MILELDKDLTSGRQNRTDPQTQGQRCDCRELPRRRWSGIGILASRRLRKTNCAFFPASPECSG